MRIHSLIVRSSLRPLAPWSVNLDTFPEADDMAENINRGMLDSASVTYEARVISWDAPADAVGAGLIPSIPYNLFY